MDEAYTLGIIRHSFAGIVKVDSFDVHPPLYYLILKFFDFNQSLLVARLLSVIPFMILAVVALKFLKFDPMSNSNRFMETVMASILLISVPNLIGFSTEIRMYGWGCLFVTSAYLIVSKFVIKHEVSIKDWVLLIIIALISLYTNYFAFIHVAFVCFLLLIFILVDNRKYFVRWLFSLGLCTIFSIPAVLFAYRQLHLQRKANISTPSISISSIINNALYPFVSRYLLKDGKLVFLLSAISSVILVLIWCFIYLKFILGIRNESREKIVVSFLGPVMYVEAIILNVVMTVFLHKIVYSRYMTLILGVFLFSAVYTVKDLHISEKSKKLIKIGICICACINSIAYAKVNYDQNAEFTEYQSVLNKIGTAKIGFVNQDSQAYTTAVNFPNKKIVLFCPDISSSKKEINNTKVAYSKNLGNLSLKKEPVDTSVVVTQKSNILGHKYKSVSGPYYFMFNEPSPAYIYVRKGN